MNMYERYLREVQQGNVTYVEAWWREVFHHNRRDDALETLLALKHSRRREVVALSVKYLAKELYENCVEQKLLAGAMLALMDLINGTVQRDTVASWTQKQPYTSYPGFIAFHTGCKKGDERLDFALQHLWLCADKDPQGDDVLREHKFRLMLRSLFNSPQPWIWQEPETVWIDQHVDLLAERFGKNSDRHWIDGWGWMATFELVTDAHNFLFMGNAFDVEFSTMIYWEIGADEEHAIEELCRLLKCARSDLHA